MTWQTSTDAPRFLQFLAEKLPSMIAYWDQELRCHFANEAYRRWFGVDPQRLPGSRLPDLLGPELYAQNRPHIEAALAGQEQSFERLIPGPDGSVRHGLAQYLPDIQDGQVVGFLVQVTEITYLKRLEDALALERSLREEIERRARELGVLLQERNEMLDVLAHEVRQPLNNASAALQNAQAALRESEPSAAPVPPLAQPLARAQTVLQQVQASIDNTLITASLMVSSAPISRIDMDIDTFVEVCINDLDAADRPRICLDRQTATRTASMNLGLMRLALRNLLANALRHSPADRQVVIRLSDSDEPLALLIDVEDAGPGFSSEVLPKLFQRGVRGRSSTGGLGLYIVRRIMELHGGQVRLLRNGRDGATVRMVLTQWLED